MLNLHESQKNMTKPALKSLIRDLASGIQYMSR